MKALQESGASACWLASCLLGQRKEERKEKSPQPPPLASSCVYCSAPPTTGEPLARLLLHTGGRDAPRQALSLRTRNPLSQSGVTQEGRELPVGGAKKRGKRLPDDLFGSLATLTAPTLAFRPPSLAPLTPWMDASLATDFFYTFFLLLFVYVNPPPPTSHPSLSLSLCSRGALRVFAHPASLTGAYISKDNTKKEGSRSTHTHTHTH